MSKIIIQLIFIFYVHAHSKLVHIGYDSTECYKLTGKYGKFHLACDTYINATLYENNKLKDSCNNYYSKYCTLYGKRIGITSNSHMYNICITTHNDYYKNPIHVDIIYIWYMSIDTIVMIILLCLITIFVIALVCNCIGISLSSKKNNKLSEEDDEFLNLENSDIEA